MNRINEIIAGLTIIHLLILAMGAYSLTRLIVTDSFPMFEKPRDKLLLKFPPDGFVYDGDPREFKPSKKILYRRTAGSTHVVTQGHWFGELITCPWCAGWWISLAVFVGYVADSDVTLFVLIPFGLRAFVGAFAHRFGG